MDLHIASYGLAQCLGIVRGAIAEDRSADDIPEGWLTGQGTALAMIATGPPDGHYADATLSLLPEGTYDIAVDTAAFRRYRLPQYVWQAIDRQARARLGQ